MRVIALIFVATLGLFVASPGHAFAEKVKTNQSTKLFARPGEQAKVLLTVKSGQNMTLLSKDGRWLKVRVNGRTGYVPRSKVDMADDGEIARNTRRRPFVDGRSKRRGFGGDAPDDRVAADAVGEGQDSGDEEDEEPKQVAKKPAAKDEDEDDEEDEDEKPAKKAPEKKVAKVEVKKPAAKESDEDEDEDADSEDDEEKENPLPAAKKTAAKEEEEEEEAPRGQKARVSKKMKVFEEPDAESEDLFVARPTDTLFALETKGSWTKVENSEGDAGWIQTSDLEIEGGGGGGGGFGKKQLNVRARMGLMFIQQGMRTQGSMTPRWPDNYNLGVSSVMLSIGGGSLIPRGNKLLGGEVTYDYAKTALGGIYFDNKDDMVPATNIGLTFHNFNARLVAGIDFKKKSGMALFGRLGYHYQGYLVTDVTSMTANPAKLPSETVKAPTIGAALSLPTFTQKIGLRFDLDTILFGATVNQTLGLQDGTSPSVKAVDAGLTATYRWKKAFDLQVAYTLHYMGIDFGPPLMSSTRGHMGTNVARTDIFHMVSIGIAKPF
jgi:hypothetical protein